MVEGIRTEVQAMAGETVEMARLVWEAFRHQNAKPLAAAAELGRKIHAREKALTERASAPTDSEADVLFVPLHLERVGDELELLARAVRTMVTDGIPFTDRAMREVNELFRGAVELLECVRDGFATQNGVLLRHVLGRGPWLERLADDFAASHERRLVEGVCLARSSSLYCALLDDLKGVEWHARKVAEKLARSAVRATPGA